MVGFDARELTPPRRGSPSAFIPFLEAAFRSTLIGWLLLAATIAMLCGCEDGSLQLPQARRTEAMARDAVQEGDFPRAVRIYEAILDGTPKTADAHYDLGLIFDDKLSEPVSALHHYRRFLRMADENHPRRAEVQGFVKRIELVMATQTVDSGIVTKREAARLRNENLRLEEANRTLRTELAVAKRRAETVAKAAPSTSSPPPTDARGFSTNPATRAAEQAVGAETRTYVVQKGDTLASISRRFYNSPARWQDIADANQNQLNGSVNLKIGQILIIPN